MGYYKKIHIKNLVLWESNPRIHHDGKLYSDEKEAVSQYFKSNEQQMRKLTVDIALFGLSPHDLVVVLPINDDVFKVFEGNRRISAIKSLSRPYYLDFNIPLRNYIKRISESHSFSKIVYCYVADSVEQAHDIVEKTHAGINGGIGRVPWGTLEKDTFKSMTNKSNTTLAYKLLEQYPGVYNEIINDLKSTNVDRVLSKKIIREIIETDSSYSGMDSIQQNLVYLILQEVQRISSESNRSIAYIFHNNDDVKKLLESFVIDKKNELLLNAQKIEEVVKTRQIPFNIKLKQSSIYVESGETYSLLENVDVANEIDIDLIKINSFGKNTASISQRYIFESTNKPGIYEVQYIYPYEETFITKICQISVSAKQVSIPVREVQFLEAAFPFTVDINKSINDLINQLIILDIRKYNLVATGCLRSLVEISIRLVYDKYKIPYQPNLEMHIHYFKKHLENNKLLRQKIVDNAPMTISEVNNFIGAIDSKSLANKLNLVTHTPGAYLSREDLFELANKTISYLLIIITILLK